MSELATIARPYAEAVFKRAKESKQTQNWSDMLAFLAIVVQDMEMLAIINDPKVNNATLLQLLLDVCQEQLDKEGINLLKLLVQNSKLKIVPHIEKLFEAYKAEDEGYVEVEVKSAYALSKEEKDNLAATLEKTLTRKVHMTVQVDKTLIGGILARAGDIVIDGSIKSQLQQLAKSL